MINIHNLQVYDVSLQAFSAVNKALDTVPDRSGPGYLVNQCRRATSSVVSNIAEGAGRLHGDRAHLLLAVPNLPASPPGRVPRPCREAEGDQLAAHAAAAPGAPDPRRRRTRRGAPRSDPGDALAVGTFAGPGSSPRGVGRRRWRGVGVRNGRRVFDWRAPVVLRCRRCRAPLHPAFAAWGDRPGHTRPEHPSVHAERARPEDSPSLDGPGHLGSASASGPADCAGRLSARARAPRPARRARYARRLSTGSTGPGRP